MDRLLGAYRNYLRLVAGLCLDRAMASKIDSSDLVQETLLRATERFEEFHGASEAELTAWLRQILARIAVDLGRRYRTVGRQVGRERSLEEMLDGSSRKVHRLAAAGGSTPSQAAQRRELGVVLADALAGLSQDHREVVVLRNLRQLQWPDVARRMRRSVGAVQMLWTRALKELRPCIEARL